VLIYVSPIFSRSISSSFGRIGAIFSLFPILFIAVLEQHPDRVNLARRWTHLRSLPPTTTTRGRSTASSLQPAAAHAAADRPHPQAATQLAAPRRPLHHAPLAVAARSSNPHTPRAASQQWPRHQLPSAPLAPRHPHAWPSSTPSCSAQFLLSLLHTTRALGQASKPQAGASPWPPSAPAQQATKPSSRLAASALRSIPLACRTSTPNAAAIHRAAPQIFFFFLAGASARATAHTTAPCSNSPV
jgi:hypothetical protein